MATIEVGNSAAFDAADAIGSRPSLWRGARYIAEVFDGADEALAALETVQGGLSSTGFQTLDWLTVLYEELAPSEHAVPRVVVVTNRNSGDVALVLPLVISKRRGLRIARFADLGVADYGGPILGPAELASRRASRRAWRAVRQALRDVDLIRLERMPTRIAGRPNPLLTRFGITPSRHAGNLVIVPETVEEYLRGLGKKYKKEVERCHRLWQDAGRTRFYRATTPEAIARVFSVLEEQQEERHAALGGKYVLSEPAYRAFYERLAMDGSEVGLGALFALEARGEIIAALFGIVHDGTFTMLRMSTAGESVGYLSPGRLVVIEAMKYFIAEGVRQFDMDSGNDPFRRGLGAREVQLYDLVIARDLLASPRAIYHRLRGRLGAMKLVRAFLKPRRRRQKP